MPNIDSILNQGLKLAEKTAPKATPPGLTGGMLASQDIDSILNEVMDSSSFKEGVSRFPKRIIPRYREEISAAKERFTKPESNIIDKIIGSLQYAGAAPTAILGPLAGEPVTRALQREGAPELVSQLGGLAAELLVPTGAVFSAPSKALKTSDIVKKAYGLNTLDPSKNATAPLKLRAQNQNMSSWEKYIGPKYDSAADKIGGILSRFGLAENLTPQQQVIKQFKAVKRESKDVISNRFNELVKRIEALSSEEKEFFSKNLANRDLVDPQSTVGSLIKDIHVSIDEVTKNIPVQKEVVQNLKAENKLADLIDEIPGLLGARGITKTINRNELDAYKEYGFKLSEKTKPGSKTIRITRQFTPDELGQLNELDDAANYMANIGKSLANDVSAFQYYDDIAKYFPTTPEGVTDKTPGYKKVSDRKIKGTDLFQKGTLAGKILPEDLVDDIEFTDNIRSRYQNIPGIKSYLEANRVWKTLRTAYNPKVVFNNFISAIITYDLSNARKGAIIPAIREFKSKSKRYQLAKQNAVFTGGYTRAEGKDLVNEGLDAYINTIRDSQDLSNNKIIETGVKLTNKLKNLTLGTNSKVLEFYNFGDDIWRFAVFIDRLEKGYLPIDAAVDARKLLIDYDINAPVINVLRDLSHPFIGYSYRILPIITEAAVKHPIKFGKWIALGYGLQKALTDDDERNIELLPERQKGTFFGIPGAPSTLVKAGKDKVVNIQGVIPGGNIFEDTGFGIPGLPQALQPSGGLAGSIAKPFVFGQTPFGEPLLEDPTSKLSQLGSRAESFLESNVPNIPGVPFAPNTKKIRQAISGDYSPYQDPKSLTEAVLGVVGVDVINLDRTRLIRVQEHKLKEDLRTLGAMEGKLKNDFKKGLLNEEQYRIEFLKIANKKILLKTKYREKVK